MKEQQRMDITKLDDQWMTFRPTLARVTTPTPDGEQAWDHSLHVEARQARSGRFIGVEVRVVASDHRGRLDGPFGLEWWTEIEGRVQHVTMPHLRRHDGDPATWLAVEDERWQPDIASVGPRCMWWWNLDEMPTPEAVA